MTIVIDEELLRRYRGGDGSSLNELIRRYYLNRAYYYFSCLTPKWKKIGEGECNAVFFSTLLACADNYRFNETSFRTYFHHAIRNNLYRLEAEALPKESQTPLSLAEPVGEEGSTLEDFVSSNESEDPRHYVNFIEKLDGLAEIPAHLSAFDLRVACLKLDDESLQSIADQLHCSIKKVRLSEERFLRLAKRYVTRGHLD